MGRLLIFVITAMLLAPVAAKAAPVQTLVQDVLYRADGSTAQGKITVQWNAFSTSAGEAVPAGALTATIGAGGSIAIPLIPNTGSTPAGSYYQELKTHMRWIVGNGNEGKIQELENRIRKHEATLQRAAGLGLAGGILLTILHLVLDSAMVIHH